MLFRSLRGYFAEFLHHDSLDRLGILYLTTCVGFGYGRIYISLEDFLGSIGSFTSPYGSASGLRQCEADLPLLASYTLTPGQPSPGMNYLPASLHCFPTTNLGHALRQLRLLQADFEHLALLIRNGRYKTGTGISTSCPSITAVALILGPDLPWAD